MLHSLCQTCFLGDFSSKPGLPCGLSGGLSWSVQSSPCLQSPQTPPGHICCIYLDPSKIQKQNKSKQT